MERQRRRDTACELEVRRALHAAGFRYRVDRSPIPGMRSKADIVFPTERIAVFVDGCFWHSCPEHATLPKANAEWWAEKLRRNVERDRAVDATLGAAGWSVVRVWEHERPAAAAARIGDVVMSRRPGPGRRRPRRSPPR
jgi:DNA mismatch endonuclease (patch repair protein)